MSDSVIRVENLSKRYTLSHQQEGSQYKSLRDAIADGARNVGKRLLGRGAAHDASREDFWALKDVSFEIKQGDRVGIIGRNGAGKSTLLKILSRIVEPTTGEIGIRGRVASLLEVGTGFHPELTGRENIFLNGAILGMGKGEITRKFDEIVAFAEVEKFLDTPVKRYSSGMYVRLAFAVAAHLEPEILIVDEVLAVGDAQFQKKCLGKMKDVSGEGRTVIFVSHNISAVQQLTTTSIVLQRGELLFSGSTAKATECYLSAVMDDSTTIYDVEHTPRSNPGLSNRIRFSKLELENHPTKLVPANSEIHFKILVKGNECVDNFNFGMTVFSIDGTAVGTFFTSENNSVNRGETATFRMELKDLHLAPGKYYCGISAGTGSHLTVRTDFDIVVDILHFEILPPEGVDGTKSSWVPWWGAISWAEPNVYRVI